MKMKMKSKNKNEKKSQVHHWRSWQRRQIEDTVWSRKIENIKFSMFNNKSKLFEQRRNDIVTTKKICVCFFKGFFLRNKNFIVYERKEWNRNF